jgi:SHS family lactate transporter-like MFS transporter
LAGFLGWTLDAFDFFLVIFALTAIAREFHKSDAAIALSITLTLAFRPVGAFLFGLLADRYGRRLPLMLDLVFYSVVEVLTGFTHSYISFMVLRALFGIGMGGEWGVGASLAMEKVPPKWRGVFSAFCKRAMPQATCWRPFATFLCSSAGAGGPCFSSEGCRRCWRCLCASA